MEKNLVITDRFCQTLALCFIEVPPYCVLAKWN